MVIVGNNCHKEAKRAVSVDEGENLAKAWGCSFFEASHETGQNVSEVFEDVAYQINIIQAKDKR